MQCRTTLPEKEWLDLVSESQRSILTYPEDFLGPDLPGKTMLRQAINSVFEGFMKDIYIRKVQAFRIIEPSE